MPKVRLKNRPHEVVEYTEKGLVDLQRWGFVLEVIPVNDDDPKAEIAHVEPVAFDVATGAHEEAQEVPSETQEVSPEESPAPRRRKRRND